VTHRTAGADNEPWLKKTLPAIAAAYGLHEALAIEKRALFDPLDDAVLLLTRGVFLCADDRRACCGTLYSRIECPQGY